MSKRATRALWIGTIIASAGALVAALSTSLEGVAIGGALVLIGGGLVVGVGEATR